MENAMNAAAALMPDVDFGLDEMVNLYDVLEELRSHVGTQFCPSVLAALEHVWREQPSVLNGVPQARLHAVVA